MANGRQKKTPRPGRYAVMPDNGKEAPTQPGIKNPRKTTPVSDADQILREVRSMRDHFDRRFERVMNSIGNLTDRQVEQERRIAVLDERVDSSKKREDDTGRFNVDRIQTVEKYTEKTIERLHKRIDLLWRVIIAAGGLGGGAYGASQLFGG